VKWKAQILNSLKHIRSSLLKCYNLAKDTEVEWLISEVEGLISRVTNLIERVEKHE